MFQGVCFSCENRKLGCHSQCVKYKRAKIIYALKKSQHDKKKNAERCLDEAAIATAYARKKRANKL